MRLHFESFLLVSVKTLGAYRMNSERRVSPLNPRLNRFIQETQAELFQLIDKWRFLKSGHKLVIPRPNKTDISYEGVVFSGSVRDVFWGDFIDPYIKLRSLELIKKTRELAEECNLPTDDALNDIGDMLYGMVIRIYDRMAETDRILRGDGMTFPPKTDVSRHIQFMQEVIVSEVNVEKMKANKPSSNNVFNFNGPNSPVQIGDGNTQSQTINMTIQQLVDEVARSGDTEAKSKLAALLKNPVVNTLLGAAAETLLSQLLK
ncbi:hypothetical protein AWI16_19250 [Enterobacter ludwigii]|nr:hypothetical protein AWI16_19250 [Enterobacter ludwigii]